MATADKTFEPAVMAVNEEAILTNLNMSYNTLADRAKILADLVDEILSKQTDDSEH